MSIARKVRYNVKTEPGEQANGRHRWTFAVVDDLEGVEAVQEELIQQLHPIKCTLIYQGSIPGSEGVLGRIYFILSDVGELKHPQRIASRKRLEHDPALTEGDDVDGMFYTNKLARS